MALLFVPPTQVIPFDAERMAEQRKVMDDFRSQAIALWQTTPKEDIKSGAFRGGKTYEWSEGFDGLLQTFFVFPSTTTKRTGEVARIAALFKKENCQILGSVVVWGTEWTKSLPDSLGKQELSQLKEASARRFDEVKSPLRLSLEGRGYWSKTIAWISDSVLGEMFAKEGLVVHSDLAGLACFKAITEKTADVADKKDSQMNTSSGNEQSLQKEGLKPGSSAPEWRRGHRQIKVIIDGKKPREPLRWPSIDGSFSLISLPLNETAKSGQRERIVEAPFSPAQIGAKVSEKLKPSLHKMNDKEIRISKREGRFVTVERGLAFGLRIGMHLVGPDGAKLHVIRYDNKNSFEDAAILLIRIDSKSKPLSEGAILQIDQAVYPVK